MSEEKPVERVVLPLGYIPDDAIAQITTPPRLITHKVPVLSYQGEGSTAIYSADQVRAMLALERERWTTICRDHAADTEQPRKPFDSYEEGWVDACNEIMWEGRQEPQAKCTRLRQFLETIRDTGMTAEDAAEHAAAALRPNKETKHE